MNIGIDIDDTINRLSDILPKYAKKFNKENKIKYKIQRDKWNFDEACGWNEENSEKFLAQYIKKCFTKVKIKKGAKKYINKLKEEGNNIIIITARHEKHCKQVYEVSEKWLKKHKIKFDKLISDSYDKYIPCEENKIDIFIDDNVEVCKDIISNIEIPVILFDSVYNRDEKDLNRVYNWKQAYNEIKKYKIKNKEKIPQ